MNKKSVPSVSPEASEAAAVQEREKAYQVGSQLLPPAEPDADYDPYLLMEETPQAEAEYTAVLWPDGEPKDQATGRRMTKEAFMRALEDATQRPTPVYEFRSVKPGSVLRLRSSERAIVDAAPGSGKTWAMVRRIFRLAADAVDPADILVLCSTHEDKRRLLAAMRRAARRSRLGDAWQSVTIRTFDSYADSVVEAWRSADASHLREPTESPPQALREAASLLRDDPQLAKNITHVLADDIQNIVGPQAALLLQLTAVLPEDSGFTYFGDRCQALFDLPSAKSNYASADQLYGQLLRANADARLLELSGSHRAGDELLALVEPFREALLSGRTGNVEKAAEALLRKVRSQDIAWQDLHPTSLRSLVTGKTLGILTRTKGEALAISNLLYQGGISHNLLLDGTEQRWGGWLGRVLLAGDSTELSRDVFAETFRDLYPGADPLPYWNALASTQSDTDRESYPVEDLLRALCSADDCDELGESPDEETAPVTVATIRCARGCEFDTVLLASDLFNGGGYTDRAQREAARRSSAEMLAEGRLAYVGLTRARKKIYLMMLPLEAVRLSQVRSRRPDGTGRWYKSQIKRLPTTVLKSYRRRSLHAFEVGIDDLLPESFADNEDVQTYLLTAAPDLPDAEVELRFLRERGSSPAYGLFDPEQTALQLGRTAPEFAAELTSALGYARNIRRDSIGPQDFPEAFRDVYVQRVVTHISAAADAPAYAKRYGDQAVWLGLDVIGFAKAVSRTPERSAAPADAEDN